MASNQKLIFVYNARTGLGNALLDGAHKILSPGTYSCNLCKMTYGAFTEAKRWKRFRKEMKLKMEFLYKDELGMHYPTAVDEHKSFPLILKEENCRLVLVADNQVIDQLKDVDELIQLLMDHV